RRREATRAIAPGGVGEPLPPGQEALDQLPYGGDEAVAVERVGGKAETVVAAEHQVVLDRLFLGALMGNALQRLLDAVTARVGLLAGGVVRPMLRPVGEAALAQAPHALGLVDHDLARFLRGDEDQRGVR